jgi:hypothetical protein
MDAHAHVYIYIYIYIYIRGRLSSWPVYCNFHMIYRAFIMNVAVFLKHRYGRKCRYRHIYRVFQKELYNGIPKLLCGECYENFTFKGAQTNHHVYSSFHCKLIKSLILPFRYSPFLLLKCLLASHFTLFRLSPFISL